MLLGLCKLLKGIEDCIRLHLTFCLTTGIRLFLSGRKKWPKNKINVSTLY